VNTEEIDPHLTTQIVVSYVRHHRLGPDQLSDLITSVHRAIGQLGQPPELGEIRTPAVSVRRSVHRDYVICLECGYRGKALRRHISTRHGLNRDEYLRRWGLRSNHPLTAPAYSERRSTLAKSLGLGRKPIVLAGTSPAPALTDAKQDARKSRPASKSVGAATEAAARPTPARKRQSRARAALQSV
jgi:predicted transcriptional regulator